MSSSSRFEDRTDAGERLAAALRERAVDADVVLAIPRGGLPLGRPVADALSAPVDVVVAKKIGAPGNPEFAIGAVAADGSVWRNEAAMQGSGGSDEAYFERKREAEAAAAREKAERYRGASGELDLSGDTVVVVDDGVATGSTARACLAQVYDAGAERVIFAVPVGPPDSIRDLEGLVDDLVCLQRPSDFRGVGQFYHRFDQVSDEEAMTYLDPERDAGSGDGTSGNHPH